MRVTNRRTSWKSLKATTARPKWETFWEINHSILGLNTDDQMFTSSFTTKIPNLSRAALASRKNSTTMVYSPSQLVPASRILTRSTSIRLLSTTQKRKWPYRTTNISMKPIKERQSMTWLILITTNTSKTWSIMKNHSSTKRCLVKKTLSIWSLCSWVWRRNKWVPYLKRCTTTSTIIIK